MSDKNKELEQLKELITKIDHIVGDWEWHFCNEGTPQKHIYNLLNEYFKVNN